MNDQTQQHFVAYHNIEEQGAPLSRWLTGYFETKKPLPNKNDVLWCFEGEGRPRQFRLVERGVVTHTRKHDDAPSEVHYRRSTLVDVVVNNLPWFAELRKTQASFSLGVNKISNPDTIDALEQFAATRGLHKRQFTDLCAYTVRHSSTLDTYADGRPHQIDTGGTSWARFADILSTKRPGEVVPVLFTPAEDYAAGIVGCAELIEVKTTKRDGTNEITFTSFRFLSSPLARADVKRENGNSLANEQYAYAICHTPADLARRLASSSEADDIAEIKKDATVPETERTALIKARRGQGQFREDLDERWGRACAVTGCSIRELLRASHIKKWSKSDNDERLDPDNGLLLIANIDILFEEGFVSFDDNGRMLMSSDLSAAQRRQLGLPGNLKRKLTPGQRRFLAYHREVFGFAG